MLVLSNNTCVITSNESHNGTWQRTRKHKSCTCVQEQIRKQLDEDARGPPLPFKRFIRVHVGHPWMQAGGSADEALLLTARVMGTFACTAYVSSVKAHSRTSSDDCAVRDGLLLQASKTLGVSLLAIIGGRLACSALASVGHRQGPCRKVLMWLLVTTYVCFCMLFCTSLIANIMEPELQIWLARASVSMILMAAAFPLAQACAAHRVYYQFLQEESRVQELCRRLHLEGATEAWQAPPPPSPAQAWQADSAPSPPPQHPLSPILPLFPPSPSVPPRPSLFSSFSSLPSPSVSYFYPSGLRAYFAPQTPAPSPPDPPPQTSPKAARGLSAWEEG